MTDERELALYAVPPAEFVSARDALARALRASGATEEAARIRQLRRPPVAAWVVNQLARVDGAGIAALLEATSALARAQRHGGAGLREALLRQREALAALVARARTVMAAARVADAATLERRVQTTLQAAAGDERHHAALREGRMVEELAALGFGALTGGEDAARADQRAEPARTDGAEGSRRGHLRAVRADEHSAPLRDGTDTTGSSSAVKPHFREAARAGFSVVASDSSGHPGEASRAAKAHSRKGDGSSSAARGSTHTEAGSSNGGRESSGSPARGDRMSGVATGKAEARAVASAGREAAAAQRKAAAAEHRATALRAAAAEREAVRAERAAAAAERAADNAERAADAARRGAAAAERESSTAARKAAAATREAAQREEHAAALRARAVAAADQATSARAEANQARAGAESAPPPKP
jgi:hypothetical protein